MNKKIFIVGVIVLFLDQLSKILIDTFIGIDRSIVVIDNFFSIVNITNTGAAFSILEGRTIFLIVLSILIILMLYRMISSFEKNRMNTFAFGLLFGGIFGNLGDRLFLGMVRDFLKFRIFNYNFPVFNIADIAITVGVGLLVINLLKGSDKSGSSSKSRKED